MRLYNWNYVVDNVGTTPCDWRIRFFGTNDNTKLFNSTGELNLPGSLDVHDQLQRDPPLDHADAEPVPDADAGGPDQVLRIDPDVDHRDLAQLRQHRPAILGRVHRPRTRLPADGGGRLHRHQRHGRLRRRFHLGDRSPSPRLPSATQYMSYTDNPAAPATCATGSARCHGRLSAQLQSLWNNVSNYFFMQPGDSYEAPIYTASRPSWPPSTRCENNHPNDWFTLVSYSWPRTSVDATRTASIAWPVPLGTNYDYATSALFFPFSTINADGSPNNTEVTPYDADPATGNDSLGQLRGHAAAQGQHLLRHGPDALLQPVRRHARHRHHPADLRHLLAHHLPDRRWPAAWDARGPRRSSSSRPTVCRTPRPPPAW